MTWDEYQQAVAAASQKLTGTDQFTAATLGLVDALDRLEDALDKTRWKFSSLIMEESSRVLFQLTIIANARGLAMGISMPLRGAGAMYANNRTSHTKKLRHSVATLARHWREYMMERVGELPAEFDKLVYSIRNALITICWRIRTDPADLLTIVEDTQEGPDAKYAPATA